MTTRELASSMTVGEPASTIAPGRPLVRTTFHASVAAMALVALIAAPVLATTPTSNELRHDLYPCSDIPIDDIDEIDFLAYFDTEQQARALAAGIDNKLFEVSVRTAAYGPYWVLRALYRTLPDVETHATQNASLRALAAAQGSRDAGFGCSSRLPRRR
jgi:hypothetical protein